MKYSVVIERMEIVEVEANNEEQAKEIIEKKLKAQDPRILANISIAKEIET